SLVLHELGHALVARRQGIDVQRIDLWFFGGLAQLSREPRSPGAEFDVAIAGPIVTLLVGIACGLGATLIEAHTSFLDAITLQGPKDASAGYDLLSFVAVMNIVLFVFNLAPGFPLDGGRIVFAAAWKLTGDRNRGMRIAGRGGVGFAYLLGGLGVYLLLRGAVGDGLWFLAIAYLLLPAARGAIAQGTMRHQLLTVTVADVMDPDPVTIDGETT